MADTTDHRELARRADRLKLLSNEEAATTALLAIYHLLEERLPVRPPIRGDILPDRRIG